MKKYRVRIIERIVSHIEVEADSPDEAEVVADAIYQKNVMFVVYDGEMSGVACETLEEISPEPETNDLPFCANDE